MPRYRDREKAAPIVAYPRSNVEHSSRKPHLPYSRYPGALDERHQLDGGSPFRTYPASELHPSHSLCVARKPDSIVAQRYRLLKYKLKEGLNPRVIGLSSPQRIEGKTTAAANLALALAEGRRLRILLLDLNLRRPGLLKIFGTTCREGIVDQLRRRRRDQGAFWDTLELSSRLHMIASDVPIENPTGIINSEELAMLLFDAASHYDYVVVDLPEVLSSADVKIVQEHLDGLVIVCRAGNTTRAALSSALAQLGTTKIQGVLMLDVNTRYIL